MKKVDIKSFLIGVLITTNIFFFMGFSSTPTPVSTPIIVKSDCDEDRIISRILFCIDGANIRNGKISTYCNS
jgi:hypothetical protein